ncbi:MAG: hypothetical protein WAN11_27845 [Syntrophobacteraceae bacterium]
MKDITPPWKINFIGLDYVETHGREPMMENLLKKGNRKTLLGILGMLASIVVIWFNIYVAIAIVLVSISLFRWAKMERMTQKYRDEEGKVPNQRKEPSES